jgi:hypothetical protein
MARRRKGGNADGCLGCAGLLFLAMFATCLGSLSHAPDPPSYPRASTAATASNAPAESADNLYVHSEVNIRVAPDRSSSLVRTLDRGEALRVGPKDEHGWAPVYDYSGHVEGYVYRASDNIRTYAPRARSTRRSPESPRASGSDHAGATARCRDGWLSYSAHRSGTCSHHGGVAVWF